MKTLPILFFLPILLQSCAVIKHQEDWDKHPQCRAESLPVFNQCVALNEKGEKMSALRLEELVRQGKVELCHEPDPSNCKY